MWEILAEINYLRYFGQMCGFELGYENLDLLTN